MVGWFPLGLLVLIQCLCHTVDPHSYLVAFLMMYFISDGATSLLILRFYNSRNRVLVFVLYKMEATRVENMLQRG